MVIHVVDGEPISFSNGLVEYKGHKVPLEKIKEGLKRDFTALTKKLVMERTEGFTRFDCLTLSNETIKKLISKCQQLVNQ